MLIATNEDSAKLLFVVPKGWGTRARTIHLGGCLAARKRSSSPRTWSSPGKREGSEHNFCFRAGRGARVQQIEEFLNDRLRSVVSTPVAVPSA